MTEPDLQRDTSSGLRHPALPETKQLDFWVGEWDVQANGATVGTSIIEKLHDGCLIVENWIGRSGATGKSLNFYNPVLKKWRQVYVANDLTIWEMSGEYSDGAMRYEGEVISADESVKLTRVTFYDLPPRAVRHMEDNSSDGGKTWESVWDATYLKRIKSVMPTG